MKARVRLSKSMRIEKAKKICDLYSQGTYTIASCCQAIGIPYDTFKDWSQPNISDEDIEHGRARKGFIPEVNEMYKKILSTRADNYSLLIKNAIREGILRRAKGEDVEEVTTIFRKDNEGNIIPVSVKRVKRQILPDVSTLIFLAKVLDPVFSQTKEERKLQRGVETMNYEHWSLDELIIKKEELYTQLLSNSDL